MKYYTKIPNEVLEANQLSTSARLILCILLKYCGNDDYCFPSQERLSKDINLSPRHIRKLINELVNAGLVAKKRKGFNKPNTYRVTKDFLQYRISNTPHLGTEIPIHQGNVVPDKSTYSKGKGKSSSKKFEKLRNFVNSKIRTMD